MLLLLTYLLGRNKTYLANAASFSQDILFSSSLIRLFPDFLKPIVAWVFVLPTRWHVYQCEKFLRPLVASRLSRMATLVEGDGKMQSVDYHNHNGANEKEQEIKQKEDFLTWFINDPSTYVDSTERTAHKITLRVMAMNFAAIHTSTFAATNLLFDLFCRPSAESCIPLLQEEIETAYIANGRLWDKNLLAKLVKIESAVKESLRISTFLSTGMSRIVAAKEGVKLDGGVIVPRGTTVATPSYSIHFDDDVYEDAGTYKPFRFLTGQGTAGAEDGTQAEGAKQLRTVAAYTTSDTFLPFGHGRHACPGRFFAVMELKVLLAYILATYEIERQPVRVPNPCLVGTIMPPMTAKLRIRRRKNVATPANAI